MKTIRILFYSPDKASGWLSNAIGWWGKLWNSQLKNLPAFSHAELEFCNRRMNEHLHEQGICFSSATYRKGRQRKTGVRFAPASSVLKNAKYWYYIEINVTDETERRMFEEAQSHLGQDYDYLAIAGFCLPVRIQDEGKWYCSEIVNHVAWAGGLIGSPNRWSPLASCQMYLDAGYGPLLKLKA